MTSPFDPAQFLDMQVNEANDTERFLVPAKEYLAVVGSKEGVDVKIRNWNKRDDPSTAGVAADILWEIQDEEVKKAAGRDIVKVKQGLMLDVTDNGGLDMGKGKNVDLGLLRTAVDLNQKGTAFSFRALHGRMARVVVSHRVDKDDPEKVYAEIRKVAHA